MDVQDRVIIYPSVSLRPLRRLVCCLVALLLSHGASLAHEPPVESAPKPSTRFAVRTDGAVADALDSGAFRRWVLPRRDDLTLEVGPSAMAELTVIARLCPLDPASLEPDIARRLALLPVRLDGEALELGGTIYEDPRLTLALRLPTPDGQGVPAAPDPGTTWLVCGRQPESTAEIADRILMSASGVRWRRGSERSFDYLLRENPWLERSGRWSPPTASDPSAPPRWGLDPEERDDFARRATTWAELHPIEVGPIRLLVPPDRADEDLLHGLARELARAIPEMAARIPLELGEETIEIVVEPDYEQQGRHLGDIGPAVLGRDGRLFLVIDHPDDRFYAHHGLARWLIRRAGLRPPPNVEDGAALWLSGSWYGRPWRAWLEDLATADVLPTAEELLAEELGDDASRVLWPPVSAMVLDHVAAAESPRHLRDHLAALGPAEARGTLETLATLAPPAPSEQEAASTARLAAGEPGGSGSFRNGFSFAMANGLEVGYHAPGVDAQLKALRRLGGDAVSLMPFGYQRDATRPAIGFLNRHPSSETDAGMVHAARRAHAADFGVLWKPHLWVSHESWPGDIAMVDADDWAIWFRLYRRFIVHHAVLAEHSDAGLFSIGVELGQTLGQETEWRKLISAVRRVYGGRLTYSGNWWADYDRAPFWDALDFVGVDAYFPLAPGVEADRAELVVGARRAVAELAAAAERFGKPILLTEVGFAARQGAWVAPHEEGGELSEAHQALAYEVFLEALGRPRWLAGLYVWKVFSHEDAENRDRPDFRLFGRPAESVVARYFGGQSSAGGQLAAE